MQINPEDYLNLDNLEMHGPSSVTIKGEKVAEPSPAPSTIDEVAQALRQAQLDGKHGEVGILSARLDEMLLGDLSEAPEASKQEVAEEETSEEKESSTDDFKDSAFNKSLVSELGAEETDELYGIINSGADEDVLSAFMESANGDGKYATQVVDWARNVKAAGATPNADVQASAIDESQATAILGASDYGQDILDLNAAVTSGKMSKAQMFAQVMENPGLMQEAVRLRNANLIQF